MVRAGLGASLQLGTGDSPACPHCTRGAAGVARTHRVPQSREPAVPGAVACSSGENFSALPLRRLQSTNHSIYCFFSPQHRSSHIGLWGESGSNVLCQLQITRAFEKAPPPPPQSTPTPRPLHTQKSVKMSPEAWLPQPTLFLTGLTLLLSLGKCRLEPPLHVPSWGDPRVPGQEPPARVPAPGSAVPQGWGRRWSGSAESHRPG